MLMLALSLTIIITNVIGLLFIICLSSTRLPNISAKPADGALPWLANYIISFSFMPQICFKDKYKNELNLAGLILIEILITSSIIIINLTIMAIFIIITALMYLWDFYLKIFKKKNKPCTN